MLLTASQKASLLSAVAALPDLDLAETAGDLEVVLSQPPPEGPGLRLGVILDALNDAVLAEMFRRKACVASLLAPLRADGPPEVRQRYSGIRGDRGAWERSVLGLPCPFYPAALAVDVSWEEPNDSGGTPSASVLFQVPG
jgi:hypothetical protein